MYYKKENPPGEDKNTFKWIELQIANAGRMKCVIALVTRQTTFVVYAALNISKDRSDKVSFLETIHVTGRLSDGFQSAGIRKGTHMLQAGVI